MKTRWLMLISLVFAVDSLFAQQRDDLSAALQLAKSNQYQAASIKLFELSHSPRYKDRHIQIKYILGLMLQQMKLDQAAAFQFISVIKQGQSKYLKQALEKLALVADNLGDDTLLNYAISKVKVDAFPAVHRDMLFFRIGEFQLRNRQFDAAAVSFSKVRRASRYYAKARYNEGLAYVEKGDLDRGLAIFNNLANERSDFGLTDPARVAAMMGKARILYQKHAWDDSIAAYHEVPRDSLSWHDTIFESSWAMLRSGRFRSALSNFHSLHSDFYEETYLPESLLLRAIVYLYICQYEEIDKVLTLFKKVYKPIYEEVDHLTKGESNYEKLYQSFSNALDMYMKDEKKSKKAAMPLLLAQRLLKEGDVHNSYEYITRLRKERRRIEQMPANWKNASIGRYAKRIVDNRIQKAQARAGRQIRSHMIDMRAELVDYFEQEGFIRYEAINGRKEGLKKKIAGKDLPNQIDEKNERDFYIQNGYEYWPFRGEYWLDELGNYHYVGTQSCQ